MGQDQLHGYTQDATPYKQFNEEDDYEHDEFEQIQSCMKDQEGDISRQDLMTDNQVNAVLESPQMPNLIFLGSNMGQETAIVDESANQVRQQKTPNKKQRQSAVDVDSRQQGKLKSQAKKITTSKKQALNQLQPYQPKKRKDQHYLSPLVAKTQGPPVIQNASTHKTIPVDVLVIGSGPAALGFLVNSIKTGRLNDLMRCKDQLSNGIAIVSEEISFGSGVLGDYGINSNTSSSGFLKCITRLGQKKKQQKKFEPAIKPLHVLKDAKLNQAISNINQVINEAQTKLKSRGSGVTGIAAVRKVP